MSSTPSISSGPGMPYHLARAYGVAPANSPARTNAGVPVAGTPETSSGPAARLPSAAHKLVGAVVPGRVDFSGAEPVQTSGTLAMYANPALKNAAATGVAVGRSLDVSG